MAKHAPTTPATLARRRHTRAAPGAMDRRPDPAPAVTRITEADRERIATAIDRLIAFLDATEDTDGDSDGCEDKILDGTLGSWAGHAVTFDDEAEPSLGWTNLGMNHAPGQLGSACDGEDSTHDDEPDADMEPVCGPHTPNGGVLGGVVPA